MGGADRALGSKVCSVPPADIAEPLRTRLRVSTRDGAVRAVVKKIDAVARTSNL